MRNRVPFRPGESPFHVRGSTYLRMQSFAAERIHGGWAAVVEHLDETDYRNFASQVFLPVGLYDALPLRPMSETMAALEGLAYAESVRNRARYVAQCDITGLYKLVLRVVSPGLVADRLQRMALRYFDFGKATVLSRGRNASGGEYAGIPHILAPWFIPMLEGYATVVLETAGASSPRVRVDPPRPDGVHSGVETVAIRFEFSWD